MPEEVVLDIQMRAIPVIPESINAETREVEVIFSTGAAVERYNWREREHYVEELVVTAEAVDLSRLNNGAPVLDTHYSYQVSDILAAVVPGSARIEGGKGICKIRFLEADVDPEVDKIWAKVKGGIIRNISVGYRILEVTEIRNPGEALRVRVTKWLPMEISLVPMGADDEAVVRSADGKGGERRQFSAIVHRNGDDTMSEANKGGGTPAPAAPAETDAQRAAAQAAATQAATDEANARTAEILDLATLAGAGLDQARAWIKEGKTPAEVRAVLLETEAKRSEETLTRGQHDANTANGSTVVLDSMRAELSARGLKPVGA